MAIGEITASAAGDENLFPDALGMLKNGYPASALPGLDRAHQTGGASAENDGIVVLDWRHDAIVMRAGEASRPYPSKRPSVITELEHGSSLKIIVKKLVAPSIVVVDREH